MDKEENINNATEIMKKLNSENGNKNLIKYIENVYLNYKE